MDKINFKIEASSPDLSEIIQEKMFKHGYSWGGSGMQIVCYKFRYLVCKDGLLYVYSPARFASADVPELTFEQFCNTKIIRAPEQCQDALQDQRERLVAAIAKDLKGQEPDDSCPTFDFFAADIPKR